MNQERAKYREVHQERRRSMKEWTDELARGECGEDVWQRFVEILFEGEARELHRLIYVQGAPPEKAVAFVRRMVRALSTLDGAGEEDLEPAIQRLVRGVYMREHERLKSRRVLLEARIEKLGRDLLRG